MSETQALRTAITTWASNGCYIDNSGNYRLKVQGKPIAPWNRIVKRMVSVTELHALASA